MYTGDLNRSMTPLIFRLNNLVTFLEIFKLYYNTVYKLEKTALYVNCDLSGMNIVANCAHQFNFHRISNY